MGICNRNRIMTGVRFLFRVTLRRLDLAAEIYHLREPQKIAQVMSPGRDAEANTPFEKLPGTQINVPRLNLHKRPRHRRCPTSCDFVPWRFSDAGRRSAWIASSCRHPKTCTLAEMLRNCRSIGHPCLSGACFCAGQAVYHAARYARTVDDATSSVITENLTSCTAPKFVENATSAASRPLAITIRPIRG